MKHISRRGEMKSAVVNVATAATHAIVAAVTGKKIVIHRMFLVAGGEVAVTPKDGTTAYTGAMTLIKGVPLVIDDATGFCPFEGTAATAFNLTLGGAVQVSGRVWYTED